MRISHPALLLISLALASSAGAKPWWVQGSGDSNDTDYLPPDVAFRVSSTVDGNAVRLHWVIADGYYLYRHKMDVKAESPDLVLSELQLPQGIIKTDAYLGTQETYEQQVDASVGYTRLDYGAHPLQIKVTYQGCAKAGLCYPPINKVLFPKNAAAVAPPASHPWEGFAIGAGGFAFLLAGLLLRKGRALDMPAA